MPATEAAKTIAVGTRRAISAASCSAPLAIGRSRPPAAAADRSASATRSGSKGIGSIRQIGLVGEPQPRPSAAVARGVERRREHPRERPGLGMAQVDR